MSVIARRTFKLTAIYMVLITVAIILLFPLYVMFNTSLKPMAEVLRFPPTFIPQSPTLENFERVLGMNRFVGYLMNSLFISLTATGLSIIFASLGAYSISRFRYPGRRFLSQMILLVYMFPGVLLVIPLFLIMHTFGLVDTHYSLILSYTTFSLPFCIWMLKGFFDSLPKDLEDAAMIDGCTRLQALWKIILPLSAPGLAAVAGFAFLLSWSEYLFSITFITTDSKRTLAAGLRTLMGQYTIDYGLIMGAAVITTLPVILFFVLLQKYLIEGMTAGAVKG